MAMRQLLLAQHARTHSAAAVPSDLPLEDMLLNGLSDDKIRLRPRDGLNPIAWYLWHMARTEDVAMNVILSARGQVLDEANWAARLGVSRRDIGTGMTDAEVGDLSARVDVGALRAYRGEVGRRTHELIQELDLDGLATPVGAAEMDRAVSAGAFGPNAGWLGGFWTGRPREFFLTFTVIAHSNTQLGEAWVLREMLN
jgi:hypothetical protein